MMTTTPSRPTRRPRKPQFWMATGAVAVVLLIVAGTTAMNADEDEASRSSRDRDHTLSHLTNATSCVEVYDLRRLTYRQFAFDGTVRSVEGDIIRFDINEWFRGGVAERTTLNGASVLEGLTSAGDPIGLRPGDRLLVAGDSGFAWSCGFTQPYEETVADDWREMLGV